MYARARESLQGGFMRERDIETVLVSEVRKHGGRAYKFVSPGNDGVPDRLVVMPGGVVIFVELKSDTGRLSMQQKVQIRRLQDMRQWVEVVKGPAGLCDFFLKLGWGDAADRIRNKRWWPG